MYRVKTIVSSQTSGFRNEAQTRFTGKTEGQCDHYKPAFGCIKSPKNLLRTK